MGDAVWARVGHGPRVTRTRLFHLMGLNFRSKSMQPTKAGPRIVTPFADHRLKRTLGRTPHWATERSSRIGVSGKQKPHRSAGLSQDSGVGNGSTDVSSVKHLTNSFRPACARRLLLGRAAVVA